MHTLWVLAVLLAHNSPHTLPPRIHTRAHAHSDKHALPDCRRACAQVFKLTSKGGQFSVERESSAIPTGELDPSLIFEQDPSQVWARSCCKARPGSGVVAGSACTGEAGVLPAGAGQVQGERSALHPPASHHTHPAAHVACLPACSSHQRAHG